MTLEHHDASDLFGLSDRFPMPGWAVLDAARAHRFTGELTFDTVPAARVHLDAGRIYIAERVGDAPLGDRLVDAGALTPAQLDRGAMRVGDVEHLGRLFDRVPSVDREMVTLTTELMTDTCTAWIAGQQVRGASGTPYLHHPSGIHRWDRGDEAVDLAPGDPLPAPSPTDVPFAPPAAPERDDDPLIAWDLQLDRPEVHATTTPPPPATGGPATPIPTPTPNPNPTLASPADAAPPAGLAPPAPMPAPSEAPRPAPLPTRPAAATPLSTPPPVAHAPVAHDVPAAEGPSILHTDWVDRLEQDGLPTVEDPLASPARLPAVTVDRTDRFELIWPSGQIDEEFGAVTEVERDDGRDRVGPTARVVRTVEVAEDEPDDEPTDLWDFETTGPIFGVVADPPAQPAHEPAAGAIASPPRPDEVRETDAGTTAATADPFDLGQSPDLPGRVATRTESSFWTRSPTGPSMHGSVFDEDTAPAIDRPSPEPAQPASEAPDEATVAEPERVSALRRLIGGLRRR